MKKYCVFLLSFFSAYLVMAQSKFEKEPYLTKSLSAASIKNVEARTSGGSISVEGVNASDARIEVYLTPNGDDESVTKEELKQRLEQLYDLSINTDNNKLTAIAKSKEEIRDWTKAVNIAFRIYIPQNSSTDLHTSGGSIHLKNLSGTEEFSTSGGSLHVEGVAGKIKGKTSGGSIELLDSKDDIELTSNGGSITAKKCNGNLKLETHGGALQLFDLNGSINATTGGGGVTANNIEGELISHTSGGSVNLTDLKCSVDASTSAGSINVSMTQLGKYVKLSNSTGNVDVRLPRQGADLNLSGNISNNHLDNFQGSMDENRVKGKLNGGGVPVTINAGNGSIRVEVN